MGNREYQKGQIAILRDDIMNDNDIVREKILEYLYELNQNSRSPASAAVGIRALQQELKKRFNYKQQQISSNITYLIDRKWVNTEVKKKEFTAPGGTILHPESTKYRISAGGMDYIEGPSRFNNSQVISNINIHNISGIVTVGNSNTIVNEKYKALFNELEILHRKILDNKKIDDAERLNLSVDIESLKNQLSKTNPDKQIIARLWEGIKVVATTGECIQLISTITTMIQGFF